jgi:hypothetical protein
MRKFLALLGFLMLLPYQGSAGTEFLRCFGRAEFGNIWNTTLFLIEQDNNGLYQFTFRFESGSGNSVPEVTEKMFTFTQCTKFAGRPELFACGGGKMSSTVPGSIESVVTRTERLWRDNEIFAVEQVVPTLYYRPSDGGASARVETLRALAPKHCK